jgi:glycerol-3-phosphate dehydrogenase (NAD(P)+)
MLQSQNHITRHLLKINLPKKLKFRKFSSNLLNEKFDLIVIALSLSGIDFIGKQLKNLNIKSPILVLTKGLKYEKKSKRILTISEQLKKNYNVSNLSVLKGPCLAKELSRKNQTSVVIANRNIKIAKSIGKFISTKYYLTEYSEDVVGVEVCSAIKNIYSMIIGAGQSLNSSSNLFQKSILEMKYLIKYFKGKDETILGLSGVGDLYVSAAGGRNSKMGSYLGKGFTIKSAKKRFMPKDTVEGEQLAREIGPYVLKKIDKKRIPLMTNLLRAILNNKKLKVS